MRRWHLTLVLAVLAVVGAALATGLRAGDVPTVTVAAPPPAVEMATVPRTPPPPPIPEVSEPLPPPIAVLPPDPPLPPTFECMGCGRG